MMSQSAPVEVVELQDSGNRLASLLDRVQRGVEVIITKDGLPQARLILEPEPSSRVNPRPPRVLGLHAGSMWVSAGFGAPLLV